MEPVRVTIGMPVFNAEKYLCQAIDSILAQTYRDFVLIISDNASTDRTGPICREYAQKDARIRYSCNEKNLGASPNYNRVFHLSNSEYFKWAAYDDLLAPGFLQCCVDGLDEHPDAVLCFPRVKIIDEHGAFKENYTPEPVTMGISARERFRNQILYPHLCTQFYGLIRSSALRKTALHGNYPSADEVFLAELGLLGEFYEIPEYLFFLRKHPEQSTEGIYRVQRARTVWFDTALKNKITLPKWRYLFACIRAVRNAGLSPADQLYCYRQIGKWIVRPDHFRAMGKDTLIAMSQLVHLLLKPAG